MIEKKMVNKRRYGASTVGFLEQYLNVPFAGSTNKDWHNCVKSYLFMNYPGAKNIRTSIDWATGIIGWSFSMVVVE